MTSHVSMPPLPRRLRRLPTSAEHRGEELRVAVSVSARLLGLALLARPRQSFALLLPHTRSIHTAGMRFALDLEWLGEDGRTIRVDRAVPPLRLKACRGASAVIERPSSCRR